MQPDQIRILGFFHYSFIIERFSLAKYSFDRAKIGIS